MSSKGRRTRESKAEAVSSSSTPSPAPDTTKRTNPYHCDYCSKDITNVVRIRCAECADFDLCLECFSVGVEVYPHKNTHKYRVLDHVTAPLFEEDWVADEELLLLEAIEMYGLGNWSDVADHVGTKNKAKCEQHYYDVYLNSSTAPLPDVNAPLARPSSKKEEVPDSNSASASASASGVDNKPKSGLASVVGYMPNRGDFDTEWDNDAEMIIADMEFKPDDTPQERQLKLKVLHIYNQKLDARSERKQFILERGLLDPKEKKRTKEEKDIEDSVKVFARLHSAQEHEVFVEGLINEHRLRKRVEQLQYYRMHGVRTLQDAEALENDKLRREAIESISKQKDMSALQLDLPPSARKRGVTDDNPERSKRQKTDAGMDLTGLEGAELLSVTEKQLCSELRLLPRQFFAIKEQLLRESYSKGFLHQGQARQLIRLDITRTNKFLDFLISVGWVNAELEVDPTAPPPSSSSS